MITRDQVCGVIAVGHCRTCGVAICEHHRALGGAWPNIYPFNDWCADCKAKREADERASLKIAQAEAAQAAADAAGRAAAAAKRIPSLLDKFRRRPFRGEARTWTTQETTW